MSAKSSKGRKACLLTTRPSTRTPTAASTEKPPRGEAASAAAASTTDTETFQSELLSSLLKDLIETLKIEVRAVLESEMAVIRADITAARSELKEYRESITSSLSTLSVTVKDLQQLLVSKEELPPEQQEWSHILDQEDTKPQHIKEEHEELWSSQEEEQLQELEEADTTKFPFTPVSVKSEDGEEKPQSSQLHQRQTEQMETGVGGEDCGGAEPEWYSDPERRLQPVTEVKTDDSHDWQETREDLSELNFKNKKLQTAKRPHRCSECGKIFNAKGNLTRHMMIHTGEKPFSCSQCEKRFTLKASLTYHMTIHREKSFRCSECGKTFYRQRDLTIHMILYTGEKPFSCSQCGTQFRQKGGLKSHMLVHTGAKDFSCSVCSKGFSQRGNLTRHMLVHTGEKC
uniref:C2H2-type domain-containing protein n=1 Tax=Labrus bergylta TaxID=56723 RepID=A0A3Q3FT55_9LABR